MSCNLYDIVFIPNKKNYSIFINNNHIALSTPKMHVPFGKELYKNKHIVNLELTDMNSDNIALD